MQLVRVQAVGDGRKSSGLDLDMNPILEEPSLLSHHQRKAAAPIFEADQQVMQHRRPAMAASFRANEEPVVLKSVARIAARIMGR